MIELKRHVERAVRPIRASLRRKDRMREELFAHIQDIYAEELARGRSEEAAIARAIERFGDAGELSQSLQATVSNVERILCSPVPFLPCERDFHQRPGESLLRYAVRCTTPLAVFLGVVIVVCVLVGGLRRPERFPSLFGMGMSVWLIFSNTVLGFPVLMHALRMSLGLTAPGSRSIGKSIALILSGMAVIFGAVLSGSMIFNLFGADRLFDPNSVAKCVLFWSPLVAGWLLFHAHISAREVERFRDWESLELT